MGTIPSYPGPSRPLDGSELLAGWQDGQQIAVPTARVASLAGPSRIGAYRYGGFAVAEILAGEILMDHEVVLNHTLAANLAGCAASAGVAPALPWTLAVAVNEAPFGTITINPLGPPSLATLDGRARQVLRGDIVTVSAPLFPDGQIARVRFTLSGEAA